MNKKNEESVEELGASSKNGGEETIGVSNQRTTNV